jgi:5-methylcytosine-specific restriction endonuclease McrA
MAIFEIDLQRAKNQLRRAKTKGQWLRLLTFGLCNNASQIGKIERLVEKCEKERVKYNSLLEKAKALDEILETVIDGVRISISKNTFADFPAIGYPGYPRDWEQLRLMVISRDNHQCQEKNAYCDGPIQIHHKISLSKGGANNMDNLLTLCLYHHCCKHPHMRERYYGSLRS